MSSLFFTPWTTNESVAPAIVAAEKLPTPSNGDIMWQGFLVILRRPKKPLALGRYTKLRLPAQRVGSRSMVAR